MSLQGAPMVAGPPTHDIDRALQMIQSALLAILLAAVSGCGGASASPSSQPAEPTSTASPAPTAAATPSPAPTTAPTSAPAATPSAVFTSTFYPYTLELPAGVLTRNWRAAIVAWDGVRRIATDSLANEADGDRIDIAGTIDGALLVWGLPWDGDLAGFMELVRDNSARYHSCTAINEPSTFEVGGVQGVGQLEACDNHINSQESVFAGAVLVKDGYGLGFRIIVKADKRDVAFDHLVAWMDGLTWVTP